MRRLLLFIVVMGVLLAFFYLDGGQYLDIAFFNQQKHDILDLFRQSPGWVMLAYFVGYVFLTAFSVPGAVILTLAGGAVFGFGWGLLLVSFASTVGATLAFLIARWLLRDWVQQRFSHSLASINDGIERDGNYYLFTLRLVPIFPYVVINLAMALTPIRAWSFYWVSQLGMLLPTAVFVNAGTQLAEVDEVGDILSLPLLGSFLLLGLFPWLARRSLRWLRGQQRLRHFRRPRRFDYNLIVIGAGSAGLVSAYIAATVKASVALIEQHRMGGDCLNTGCVPSKALLHSARLRYATQRTLGPDVAAPDAGPEFTRVMQRVHQVIRKIAPHDSSERYTELGVNCLQGHAVIVSPWEVEVTVATGQAQRISARNLVIASGARPAVPDIPGLDKGEYLTTETIWDIEDLPRHLIIIGGGPVGCEMAQAFARLGSEVTLLVRSRLLPREDGDVVEVVQRQFEQEGIRVLQQSSVLGVEWSETGVRLSVSLNASDDISLAGDRLLIATGRRANTGAMGLETVGVECEDSGAVKVDNYLRTTCPTIFACGDVAGAYQFTHVASHHAWYATVNALFGGVKKFAVDDSVIPWVTFCSPEVARVGFNEQQAAAEGVAFEVTRYDFEDLDRAITDDATEGFIKVLTRPGSDQILGVTIVADRASELIAEFILAMKHDLGLNTIFSTIHIYPTLNEANKFVAGNWKKAHQPQRLLRWVERFHRLRR